MHPSPNARALAVEQRDHDSEGEQISRREIRNRDADSHRSLPWQAGDRHQPTHPLRDLIDAAPTAIRSGLAESTDASIHEARINRMQIFPGDLQPMLHLDAHVL